MTISVRFRHLILIAIIASQLFSSVLFVPGGQAVGFSYFRLILILVSVFFIARLGISGISYSARIALILCMTLIAIMLISLWWSQNYEAGFRQISYVVNIMLLIYSLEYLIESNEDFRWFCFVIIAASVGIMAFALYEFEAERHFHSSNLEMVLKDRSLAYTIKNSAWFTFGNPNDLAAHLMIASFFGFLFFRFHLIRSFIIGSFLLCAIYIAERNQARLALFSLITFTVIYFTALSLKWSSSGAMLARMAVIGGGLSLGLMLLFAGLSSSVDTSTVSRIELLLSATKMAGRSLFVGIGSGSFEVEMIRGGFTSFTYGIVNPHSAFFRIFAENGILGLIVFCLAVFGPIGVVARAGRTTPLGAFSAACSVSLFPLLSISSDPLSASSLQLAIAVCWVAARLASAAGDTPSPAPKLRRSGSQASGRQR